MLNGIEILLNVDGHDNNWLLLVGCRVLYVSLIFIVDVVAIRFVMAVMFVWVSQPVAYSSHTGGLYK